MHSPLALRVGPNRSLPVVATEDIRSQIEPKGGLISSFFSSSIHQPGDINDSDK